MSSLVAAFWLLVHICGALRQYIRLAVVRPQGSPSVLETNKLTETGAFLVIDITPERSIHPVRLYSIEPYPTQ